MAIVIKELIVTTRIQENLGSETPTLQSGPPLRRSDKQALIQECVEEILKILERQAER